MPSKTLRVTRSPRQVHVLSSPQRVSRRKTLNTQVKNSNPTLKKANNPNLNLDRLLTVKKLGFTYKAGIWTSWEKVSLPANTMPTSPQGDTWLELHRWDTGATLCPTIPFNCPYHRGLRSAALCLELLSCTHFTHCC